MGVAEDELANALERLQNTPGKKVEEVPNLKYKNRGLKRGMMEESFNLEHRS